MWSYRVWQEELGNTSGKAEQLVDNIVTNKEFDLLDELYFVTSFEVLREALGWSAEDLLKELSASIEKGWVKCLEKKTEQEVLYTALELQEKYTGLFFLASKKGLMEHNAK